MLSRAEFMRRTGIPRSTLVRMFPSWKAAVAAAGLAPRSKPYSNLDGRMLGELARVCERLGHFPSAVEFRKRSGRHAALLQERFGYWWQLPERLLEWLEEREPSGPAAEIARREVIRVQAKLKGQRRPSHPRRPQQALAALWQQRAGLRYGPPLDCSVMRHEPTSENGVIFLFGLLCEKLGFVVDAIHAYFPDCEALRRVEGHPTAWEPVRIEFELRSNHFRTQRHRADLCDIIVCWEHDWPDCPLEVIALKDLVKWKDPLAEKKEREDEHTSTTKNQHHPKQRLARELL